MILSTTITKLLLRRYNKLKKIWSAYYDIVKLQIIKNLYFLFYARKIIKIFLILLSMYKYPIFILD